MGHATKVHRVVGCVVSQSSSGDGASLSGSGTGGGMVQELSSSSTCVDDGGDSGDEGDRGDCAGGGGVIVIGC